MEPDLALHQAQRWGHGAFPNFETPSPTRSALWRSGHTSWPPCVALSHPSSYTATDHGPSRLHTSRSGPLSISLLHLVRVTKWCAARCRCRWLLVLLCTVRFWSMRHVYRNEAKPNPTHTTTIRRMALCAPVEHQCRRKRPKGLMIDESADRLGLLI